jgi:malonyl-CoA O-methyltransferase
MGMPALVVARPSLGTINHTLLTLEALRRRQIEIAGVILAGNGNTDNRSAIERFGNVIVIDEMPHFAPLTPEVLGHWATSEFDTTGQLARYFQ